MTQPSPRERIENLWDRATPVGPLLDELVAAVLREAADEIEARIQKMTGLHAQHDYVIMRLNHERRTLAAIYRNKADGSQP
jgi:hypothetical protein